MAKIIEQMGLDADNLKWYQIGSCNGMDINWFYDKYETDKEIAVQIDQLCMRCPVVKQCYSEGVKNKEKGTWGGVYLDLGRTDKLNNSHKTPEVWKTLKKLHGTNNLH